MSEPQKTAHVVLLVGGDAYHILGTDVAAVCKTAEEALAVQEICARGFKIAAGLGARHMRFLEERNRTAPKTKDPEAWAAFKARHDRDERAWLASYGHTAPLLQAAILFRLRHETAEAAVKTGPVFSADDASA